VTVRVVHNPAASRFEAEVEGRLCRADYRMDGDTMLVVHTEVAPILEGQGIAGELVREVFAHAQREGLKVAPMCSYVRAWARRHPEVAGLLAAGW
jgi:predicted GNAT family acetyltransferase